MEKRDIVIASLEFAKRKSLSGEMISAATLTTYLVEKIIIDQNGPERHFVVQQLFYKITGAVSEQGYMSLDAYLGLLDYEELQQARNDAREAKKDAKHAIWAAIGLGVLQLITSVYYGSCAN